MCCYISALQPRRVRESLVRASESPTKKENPKNPQKKSYSVNPETVVVDTMYRLWPPTPPFCFSLQISNRCVSIRSCQIRFIAKTFLYPFAFYLFPSLAAYIWSHGGYSSRSFLRQKRLIVTQWGQMMLRFLLLFFLYAALVTLILN